MNKFLATLTPICLMLSCSIDDNYQVKLSCETQVTQDKINDLNYIIEDRYKTPKDLADIETIIQNGLLDGYVENMNECIENNYPFEKHVYIFNKNDMNNFGKYDISKSSSYCWLTKIEMLETLSVMRVTDNYLDFGETHPMKINKNNLFTGTKLSYLYQTIGPYEYLCDISKYE
tara:strand:- start:557 stop:1078 length:522 start_codon:yes stop_codon:yes gene_type:complete